MELLVATTNRGKIREIQRLLKKDLPGITLYSLDDLNIQKESPETGESFLENAAALATNCRLIESFTGEVEGIILNETRGSGGFGCDPLFFYPPLKKTFAQLSTSQKNRISHRAKALQQLKDFLIKTQKNQAE